MKQIIINTAKPKPITSRLLMIYTGGTLGMVYDKKGKHLVPFDFEQIQAKIPELNRFDIEITVISISPLIDSANVVPENWLELAQIIGKNYNDYDGFVILHGTDTMAYSASALSFLLEGLNKPVVFTGAQLPIGEARNDARINLITALEIASAKKNNLSNTNIKSSAAVPEVCIYFDYFLWRGNRSRKVESRHFDAFSSQNYPHLAEVGIDIQYNYNFIKPVIFSGENEVFKAHSKMDENVGILKLFPGISLNLVETMLFHKETKAIVLETYGSGTAPTDKKFLALLEKAIKNEVIIFNISQCYGGMVMQGMYETSKHLEDIGVISGKDMTTESAITKLMFLLGKNQTKTETEKLLKQSICGEMTV